MVFCGLTDLLPEVPTLSPDIFRDEQFDVFQVKTEVEPLTNIRNYKQALVQYFSAVRGASNSWFNRFLDSRPIVLKNKQEKVLKPSWKRGLKNLNEKEGLNLNEKEVGSKLGFGFVGKKAGGAEGLTRRGRQR